MSPLSVFRIRNVLPLPSVMRFRRAIRRIDALLYGIIDRRRQGGDDPGDLLSMLLAA